MLKNQQDRNPPKKAWKYSARAKCPRHASRLRRSLRKQELNLKAQLPLGTELRSRHVAVGRQLSVDRQLRDRMSFQWQYLP